MFHVDPRRLELFTLEEIVDHLEYLTREGGKGGHQA